MKNAKKKLIGISILFIVLGFMITLLATSCHLFAQDDTERMQIYFDESNITIYVGGYASFSLRIEPYESANNYSIEYSISNQDIALIFQANRRGCVVSGLKAGSTVITAKVGNAETKAVITVIN